MVAPARGWRTGVAYTVKTSPNGVSPTTHELSFNADLQGDRGIDALRPNLATTWRPKGGGGFYTQAGVEPELSLSNGEDAPLLSLPATLGVGWDDFYERGVEDVLYGPLGLAYSRAFESGGANRRFRAEALAVYRDGALRNFGPPGAKTAGVVPLVTVSLSLAY